jgi:putative oxidoreductase
MKLLTLLLKTDSDVTGLVLRLVLGVIFFAHGAQLTFGWFDGYGFGGTMGFFTGTLHIPAPLAFLAIVAQFAGGIGLILGLLTRLAALGIGANMLVAVTMVHAQYGFFMNWSGTQKGEGFEYHLLAIAIAIALIVRGGGKWALDTAIEQSLHVNQSEELASQSRNPQLQTAGQS